MFYTCHDFIFVGTIGIVDWLINYKTTDGKAKNILASETPTNATEAVSTIIETHGAWKSLMDGKAQTDFWLQSTAPLFIGDPVCAA